MICIKKLADEIFEEMVIKMSISEHTEDKQMLLEQLFDKIERLKDIDSDLFTKGFQETLIDIMNLCAFLWNMAEE